MSEEKIRVELDLTPSQIENIKIELDLDQVEELEEKIRKYRAKKCFDRVELGEPYYYISCKNILEPTTEACDLSDETLYNNANYCTNHKVLLQQSYKETLNRQLWRFSMMNGGDKIDWKAGLGYYIYRDLSKGTWYINWSSRFQSCGVVYFASKGIALRAIKEVIKPFIAKYPDFKI